MTPGFRYRFRVLDWFGTDAPYNDQAEAKARQLMTNFAYGLYLRQMYTAYPVNIDNSFLGFGVLPSQNSNNLTKGSIGLLHGKDVKHINDKISYLKFLSNHVELHATIGNPGSGFPSFIHNHGVMAPDDYKKLSEKVKFFIGLGDSLEGPSGIDFIARGGVYLNPKILTNRQFNGFSTKKPTFRKF